MKEALFYKKENSKIRCLLCPHKCLLNDNQTGVCRGRKSQGGKLWDLTYFKSISFSMDPIEKKPLKRFFPGSFILSIGPNACNFKCEWCQNWQVSQENVSTRSFTSEELFRMVEENNSIGVAFTYTEPFMMYETIMEIGREARERKKKIVLVSNGYVNSEPLDKLVEYTDAFNIDLKVFNEEKHKKWTKGELAPVMNTIATIIRAKKHLEITHLVVPGVNDDLKEGEEMFKWIASLGRHVPLHLSRYYPAYNYREEATSRELILKMEDLAKKYLDYVYLGNMGWIY